MPMPELNLPDDTPLNILIGCEESQTLTKALRALGHNAFSCDLLPCSGGHPEWHIQGDVFDAIHGGVMWNFGIFHPPCTFLTVTGNKWFYHPEDRELPAERRRPHPRFPERAAQRTLAVEFAKRLFNCPIPLVAIENPVGALSSSWRKPDQYVHPYYFGDPHSKKTGLWLKGLPKLIPTRIVEPEFHIYKNGRKDPMWHYQTIKLPASERAKARSKTFPGMASAMAVQYSAAAMAAKNTLTHAEHM